MTISKDRVKPSPQPDSWKLKEIFATGVVLGGYLALMTVIFFWAMIDTDFFSVSTSSYICQLGLVIGLVEHLHLHLSFTHPLVPIKYRTSSV